MRLRWHWGIGIGLVYAAFAAATMGFVVFAMGQKVELVSEDYYERGLDYDRHMAAAANAAALGDAVRVDAAASDHALRVIWNAARPGRGDGTIKLYRPSDASLDQSAPVAPDADGGQSIALSEAPAGHWVVRVTWRADGREYFLERSVIVK